MIDKRTWELVVEYLPLVRYVANKKGLDEDAIYHCGIDVLLRCICSYKPGSTKLSTYMMTALYRSLHGKETLPRTFLNYSQRLTFDERAEQETRDSVSFLQESLDKYDWNLLSLYFFHHLTYEQIGDVIGLSKTRAYVHVQKALQNARKVLTDG